MREIVCMKITVHPHTMRSLFELKRWQAFEWLTGCVASQTRWGCITRATANAENVQMQCVFVPWIQVHSTLDTQDKQTLVSLGCHAAATAEHVLETFDRFSSVAHSYSCLFPHFTHHAWLVLQANFASNFILDIAGMNHRQSVRLCLCVLLRSNSKCLNWNFRTKCFSGRWFQTTFVVVFVEKQSKKIPFRIYNFR